MEAEHDADRRAFRAFVKANHPDLGGDPRMFVAGLGRWRPPGPAPKPPDQANVVFHRTPRGPARYLRWFPGWRSHQPRKLKIRSPHG